LILVFPVIQEVPAMDRIAAAVARLEQARGLPAILDAACEAFQAVLAVSEEHEDPRGGTNTPMAYCLPWLAGTPSSLQRFRRSSHSAGRNWDRTSDPRL
jgi:hypothetical protein